MEELIEFANEIIRNIPAPRISLLEKNLASDWRGCLCWVAYYRLGVFPDGVSENNYPQSKKFARLYAQLLNLAIGLDEFSEFKFIPAQFSSPLEFWSEAIKEQIQHDFDALNQNSPKGELAKIKAHNARLLRRLKEFEFKKSDGTAMGQLLSLATHIAEGQVGDSKKIKRQRLEFRKKYWNPYVEEAGKCIAIVRDEALLMVEQDNAVYLLMGGRKKSLLYPRTTFKSGRGRKSK
jgi:hypothetical protein